ncbi:MAG: fluoride efflux transporter CrcB [Fusobacteria bacterium]|nr:MAG: fluoride efflux transporter CrcB [Fusobacteriota bacterium]
MILNFLLVGIGGGIGALSRYVIDKYISSKVKHHIPFGTLGVNLIGLFLIGFFYSVFEHHIVSENLKHFIVVGFLGALTTFSSYAYGTLILFEKKKIKEAIYNILLNNILGMVVAFLGAVVGKYI